MHRIRNKQLAQYVAEVTIAFMERYKVDQRDFAGLINPHLPGEEQLGDMVGFYYFHGKRNPRRLVLYRIVDQAAGAPIAEEWARPILERMRIEPPLVAPVLAVGEG
jgi:hypothetical protein